MSHVFNEIKFSSIGKYNKNYLKILIDTDTNIFDTNILIEFVKILIV